MYELNRVGENTFYMQSPAKIGFIRTESGVYVVDSGNDKEAAKKIIKTAEQNGWTIKAVVNTHSNADHIGGNRLLQDRLNCPLYANGAERAFVEYPLLESAFLYGGFPPEALRNKFLCAEGNSCKDVRELEGVDGLSFFSLKGHFFDMIGIRDSDDICFVADSLVGQNILEKYHISFICDIKEYLNTLNFLEKTEAKLFIPSHAEPCEDIRPLVKVNRDKVNEIAEFIISLCVGTRTFDDILREVFVHYNLTMNDNQYVLVGSTVRSYLSYLAYEKAISFVYDDNKLFYKQIN